MGRTFKRHGETIRASFTPVEERLLRSAREQLRDALTQDDPADPVIERLYPSTVLGDTEADHELRGLLKDDLLTVRLAGLDALVEVLDRGTHHRHGLRVELRDDEPLLVLGVINDLRLAIGARLGIERIDRDAIDPEDPVAYRIAVMDHLAWWQEELLAIIDPMAVAWSRTADLAELAPDELDPDDAAGHPTAATDPEGDTADPDPEA
jgi:hypothetical protein